MIVQKDNSQESQYLALVISCVGLVFSFAWHCVNKGSKQWQENWENHVDLLEDEVVGPLYKVVISRPDFVTKWYSPKGAWGRFCWIVAGPAKLSVSKISQIVSLFVVILWITLVIHILPLFDSNAPVNWKYVIIVGIAVGTCGLFIACGRTDKENYNDLGATLRKTTIKEPNK
ncbi:MAG: hypothetical protein HY910_12655 [Desulfarculus sp.]|nr:hypothetical protein [Desulfarculus sp.]